MHIVHCVNERKPYSRYHTVLTAIEITCGMKLHLISRETPLLLKKIIFEEESFVFIDLQKPCLRIITVCVYRDR
jgi:hypothetical protein